MYILRASFTNPRSGWTFYAKNYGKKAFRIPVRIKPPNKDESGSV